MSELWTLTARELAQRIACGDVSARDAVEAHVERIQRVNPHLNAVVVERYEAARAEAEALDRRRRDGETLPPLGGVPITIKECFDLEGLPSTFGVPSRVSDRAPADDPHVARLRAAGAIVLGKTNLSQLMIFIEADNPVYGRTNNPWNLTRSSGGSSGGEGAIVAAGGSPLGLASDIGGSIRVPAAFNGIVGLKPTTGRLDDMVRLEIYAGQRAIVSQVGPLARDVGDAALALEILNGGAQPDVLPPKPLRDFRALDPTALRIGFYTEAGPFKAAPAVARAVREAAAALERLGASVVAFEPPHPERAQDLLYGILSADGARGASEVLGKDRRDARVAELLAIASKPRPVLAAIERLLAAMGQRGLLALVRNYGYTDTYHYWKLVQALEAYKTIFVHALDTAPGGPLDALLSPANALPAIPHGASADVATGGAFALINNVLGYPAGVVPVTRVRADEEVARKRSRDRVERGAYRAECGSAGLPVGVQVAARPWREDVALAVMSALQSELRSSSEYPRTPVDVSVV